MNTEQNYAKEQAIAKYSSIVGMLAAVDCDYDRLDELKEDQAEMQREVDDSDGGNAAASSRLALWMSGDDGQELAQLIEDAGDCESQDDASERIQESPLSIEVRSGWANCGDALNAEEFQILLCTGGPAVRILGELDQHGQPDRAWIEYQDWGTPWTQYFDADGATLVRYAQQFYFGE